MAEGLALDFTVSYAPCDCLTLMLDTVLGTQARTSPPGDANWYGVSAYALAYDHAANTVVVTDRSGFLTIYKAPRAVVAK